ncbi:gfo/Idh/MocA family oxidoreductase [Bremerella cremea]|uniref:Gfo/Idh/MocA family oxidoreductase n=1 Tax=Bremerella cremea TaxID=1031537 RepID=A0A368KY85_9BACT|nr:Gfo/Idh/MocA family oxidoreductase [Bremerella cremea]RCS54192.1 gfo/Idh/MocA family oxidoreductase [Bremerella cremea]
MSNPKMNRRFFLKTSATAAAIAGTGFHRLASAAESKSPNELLDVACIGVQNRASANVSGVSGQNIVAMCDIDDKYLDQALQQYASQKSNRYNDFRVLLDKEKSLDAVVVSTPDHTHAPASMWAMQLGKHCYCEKPLTHTVHEAREMTKLAAKKKLATQMGTQIHAGNNYRRVVEAVQSGAVGDITKVDVWVGKGWGGGKLPTDKPPVPKNIHWDVWLGPAAERPYSPVYLPANWRRWWDFGGGTLGDMGCHYIDLVFWALKLKYPSTVSAEGAEPDPYTAPLGLTVNYKFPKTDVAPAIEMTWRDGTHTPSEVAGIKVPGSGVMFHGTKGKMFADYGGFKLYPENKFADWKAPEETIPNSIGHYEEWIKACKEGTPTTCNFSYSGPLTETVLLGNVAYRSGGPIEWDAENLKVTNNEAANQFIERKYREGWRI